MMNLFRRKRESGIPVETATPQPSSMSEEGENRVCIDTAESADESGSESDEEDDWKEHLGLLVQNHVGTFRKEHTDSASQINHRRRSSTARGARRRSISQLSEASALGDLGMVSPEISNAISDINEGTIKKSEVPDSSRIVKAAIADCTQKPFAAQGLLKKFIHGIDSNISDLTFDEPDEKYWELRWVEVRGPFIMQWRSEADSKVKGAPPESQDVTMPGSVIDLRTLSECGMYNERVLFLRFKNSSIPEILFRPAQSRWLSEFHFWLEALEIVMADYEEDPDTASIQNDVGEMIVDMQNNPPPPLPPRINPPPPLPPRSEKAIDISNSNTASKDEARPSESMDEEQPSNGTQTQMVMYAEEEDDADADAYPSACGFSFSFWPFANASPDMVPISRSNRRSSFFQQHFGSNSPQLISDPESNPHAWKLQKLNRNTVNILVYSLVTSDPQYEQGRTFKVEVTRVASGGGQDLISKSNTTTFAKNFRFAHNSRVVWPTIADTIEMHFELYETIKWYGDVCIAHGQLTFDTTKPTFSVPYSQNTLVDFYGMNDGLKLSIALRTEIEVTPTMPIPAHV